MADLYALLHHLRACPEAFLAPSLDSDSGIVHTDVLLRDLYRMIYGNLIAPDAALPDTDMVMESQENHRLNLQLSCWFFSHDFFLAKPQLLPGIHQYLFDELATLSEHVAHRQWVEDEDRAEEFVRLALAYCGVLPEGESAEEAADKLEALSTLKRQAVLRESNASLERAMEIRRKMAEQKAREAANVYGRE